MQSIRNSTGDDFFLIIRRFQNCVRVFCSDLKGASSPTGTLLDLVDSGCIDINPSTTKLAGFSPVDDVYEVSRIDLDILQIGNFMETRAYDAAMDCFVCGFNSRGTKKPLSLRNLAMSAGRSVVPQCATFTAYFGTNNYAVTAVEDAIEIPSS